MTDPDLLAKRLAFIETCVSEIRRLSTLDRIGTESKQNDCSDEQRSDYSGDGDEVATKTGAKSSRSGNPRHATWSPPMESIKKLRISLPRGSLNLLGLSIRPGTIR